MDIKEIKHKGLKDNIEVSDKDLELINKHTLVPLTKDDVYTFKVQICDNDVDRVGDKMTDSFLEQVAEHITGVTGLKDHDWNVENQLARLYDAEVVTDDTNMTVLGEPRKYVLGKAYTLSKNEDLIDNINAGLLKETSISFNSNNDTCSICGAPMVKDENDIGHCSNRHTAGHYYDNNLCYNKLNELEDILEWSLVAVPCQRKAGINNKNIGGNNIMKKAEYLIRQFMSSKSYDKAAPEDKAALDEAVDKGDEVEMSDEDISKLVEENGKLKAKVKELEDKVKEAESGRERDKIEAIVSKGLDELKPLTEKVKEMMLKDIPWDTLKLEDGQIPGMDDVFAGIKDSYKGLYEDKVEDKGCGDGDVETKEDPENKEDTEEVETKETPETPEVKSKGIQFLTPKDKVTRVRQFGSGVVETKGLRNSEVTLGVSSKSAKNTNVNNVKPGIYFN